MPRRTLAGAVLAVLLFATDSAAAQGILEKVKDQGVLRCGVNTLGIALSTIDENGDWTGFYPEMCRAVAAAVLGDRGDVEFVTASTHDRFDLVREGAVDVLMESSTWTLGRDTHGLEFPAMFLFDGQGFLVYKPLGINKVDDLKGRSVCVQGVDERTTSIGNLRDLSREKGLDVDVRVFKTMEGSFAAFFDRQCDAITTDVLIMSSLRQSLAPEPGDYVLLPDRVSKEPLSPTVRQDDPQWTDIVRWVVYALLEAEELGVTSENIEAQKKNPRAAVRRLLGLEGDLGPSLGLDPGWADRMIAQVGNYGEIYDRTLRAQLLLDRGPNALWTRGGLLWAPPMR